MHKRFQLQYSNSDILWTYKTEIYYLTKLAISQKTSHHFGILFQNFYPAKFQNGCAIRNCKSIHITKTPNKVQNMSKGEKNAQFNMKCPVLERVDQNILTVSYIDFNSLNYIDF